MITNVKDGLFKKIVQTTSYLPNFVSWVVVFAILQQFLGLNDGVVNSIREQMGLERIFFLNEPSFFYPVMFISYVWKSIGMGSIIYIAALSGVDVSLYEAAHVDGANKLQQIWHISLPSIAPTATMLFILSLGSILSAGWDQIYLLKNPGNSHLADILDTYVLEVGLLGGQFGYASAVGLFSSIIALVLIITANKISKRVAEISLF
jgi:putative aldouronate transport system permease protein